MLSRVAENLYWVARYIERAEDTARLINVNSNLLLDMPSPTGLSWSSLIEITGKEDKFNTLYDTRSERNVIDFLCVSERNSNSIISSLGNARENLRTTRDVVPREIWEEVNQCYLDLREQSRDGLKPRHREQFLKSVVRSCQTLTGLIEGTISHNEAKIFLTLGRHIERADMTTRILDVRSNNLLPRKPEELIPFEHLQWMSVLKSLTAYQMYRQEVRLRVRGPDVLRYLLQNKSLPRSVFRSLEEVSWKLLALPNHERSLAMVTIVKADIAEANVQALARDPDGLHQFIDELQIGFNRIHGAIATAYFAVSEQACNASSDSTHLDDED